jgi:hypothetical protein
MRARWRTSWGRPGVGVVAIGLLRSVVLLVGGIVGLALGHVDVGLGVIILRGSSLAAFFWGMACRGWHL